MILSGIKVLETILSPKLIYSDGGVTKSKRNNFAHVTNTLSPCMWKLTSIADNWHLKFVLDNKKVHQYFNLFQCKSHVSLWHNAVWIQNHLVLLINQNSMISFIASDWASTLNMATARMWRIYTFLFIFRDAKFKKKSYSKCIPVTYSSKVLTKTWRWVIYFKLDSIIKGKKFHCK